MDYCPHCMTHTTAQTCPACGKPAQWQAPTHQLPVGTLLRSTGDHIYQIGAAKGQGGFGITYAAMDLRSNTRVAVKEYFPSHCAGRDAVTRVLCATGQQDNFRSGLQSFLQEARTLASVGALDSVVSVRDYFESNGTAYIVMEYVDGHALHDVVAKRGLMRKQELFPILRPLLRDLAILHRAGVIHRDISPDNLILTKEGKLKLLDFGAARSTSNGKAMTVMLKAGFSPLEQYQSRGQGPYTDVYAMAGTIYYCLTGRVPPAAVDRITTDELILPNALGAGLTQREQDALVWGLNVMADKRPQNVTAFANALLPVPTGVYAGQISPSSQQGGHVSQNIIPSSQQGAHMGQNIIPSSQQGGHVSQNIIPSSQQGAHMGQNIIPSSQQDAHMGQNIIPNSQQGGYTAQTSGQSSRKGLFIGIGAAAVAVVLLVSGLLIGSALGKKDPSEPVGPKTEDPGRVTDPAELPGGTMPVVEKISEDGFTYRIENGEAIITGCPKDDAFIVFPDQLEGCTVTVIDEGCMEGDTVVECVLLPIECAEIRANAFAGCTELRNIGCYSTADADPTAFDGCPRLRAITLSAGESVDGWALPADCKVFSYDLETGKGSLTSVDVDDDGVIYGITDSDEAVILDVPSDITYLNVPADISGYPVVWMWEGALDSAYGDLTVFMCPNMGFDYSLLDKAEWDCAYSDDFCFSWYLTCAFCYDINAERGDAEKIMPDWLTVQASLIRVKEISTNYSHIRDDGSNWTTVLDGLGLQREYARTRNRKVATSAPDYDAQVDAIVEEMVEAYSGTYDDAGTKYYTGLGVSMFVAADDYLYFNIIGID